MLLFILLAEIKTCGFGPGDSPREETKPSLGHGNPVTSPDGGRCHAWREVKGSECNIILGVESWIFEVVAL